MNTFKRSVTIDKVLLTLLALVFLFPSWIVSQTPIVQRTKTEIWEQIAQFFSPPYEFKNQFGDYSSPLIKENGERISTRDDWDKQRSKIKTAWQGRLGTWPALIQDQQLALSDTIVKNGFTQHRISLQWTPNEVTQGYLLVPHLPGKKPAVITLYYEPETAIGLGNKPFRDYAIQLAKRGFVTLSLGTTEATQSKTYALYYPSIDSITVQPLSMLAYAAANAWQSLSIHPEVDSTRIGVMGHSFGGKWALFASCLFEKFACAVWSDPGILMQEDRPSINYWEPWYLGFHPKPWRERGMITTENPARGLYPQLVEEGLNLHELHALMAPRPFLVSGGSEDPKERWLALNYTVAINQILGFDNRVGMTNRKEHSPDAQSNEVVYLFFEYFLK